MKRGRRTGETVSVRCSTLGSLDLRRRRLDALLTLILFLPPIGVFLGGQTVSEYLEFPPRLIVVDHAPFSLPIFALAAIVSCLVLIASVRYERVTYQTASVECAMPWWGWGALAALLVSWGVAWTRQPVLAPLQLHTFLPLWLSYVVIMNGLLVARTGMSPLTHATGRFLQLFPISAAFWWAFEYLNRFVQNWQYENVEQFSAGEYFSLATLSFSTVLPAVYCTALAIPSLPFRFELPRLRWWVSLSIGSVTLAALAILPNLLFPFVWLAPLFILHGLGALKPEESDSLTRWAVASLCCGFLWELWNYYSLAKWVYTIPYVGGWEIFEMPILGYLGYLPFGIICREVSLAVVEEEA